MYRFKRNIVVDTPSVGGSPGDPISLPLNGDPVRTDYRGNWYEEGGQLRHTSESERPLPSISDDPSGARIDIRFAAQTAEPDMSIDVASEENAYGFYTQVLEIRGDMDQWEDHDEWVDYLSSAYAAGQEHLDHTHMYSSPYSPGELQILGADLASYETAQVEFNYNFLDQRYESVTAPVYANENDLPYAYSFPLSRLTFPIDGRAYTNYTSHISLGGSLPTELWDISFLIDPHTGRRTTTAGNYLDSWARTYPSARSLTEFTEVAEKYGDIFVTAQASEYIQGLTSMREIFPMQATISFALPDRRFGGGDPDDYPTPIYQQMTWIPDGPSDEPVLEQGMIINIMRNTHIDSTLEDRYYTSDSGFKTTNSVLVRNSETGLREMRPTTNPSRNISVFNFGKYVSDVANGVHAFSTTAGTLPPVNDAPWLLLGDQFSGLPINPRFLMLSEEELAAIALRTNMGLSLALSAYYNDNRQRSYEDVLKGELAYSEDLFFKVIKRRITPTRDVGVNYSAPIQTYYLPNTRAVRERLDIIDTQLKYGSSYEYEIKTCRLVFGAKTTYKKVEALVGASGDRSSRPEPTAGGGAAIGRWLTLDMTPDYEEASIFPIAPRALVPGMATTRGFSESRFWGRLTVEVRPSIQLLELPYMTRALGSGYFGRGTLLDTPPLPPDVGVYPYKGINDKVLFTLNTGVGSVRRQPMVFNNDIETQRYIENLRSMNTNPADTTILYENDDPSVRFEIYRLSYHPAKYEDFANQGEKFIVSTESPANGYRLLSSTAFIDDIVPNNKYYYIFRAFDAHDHVSYPSDIYEVELVDDGGAVFPVIRAVPFRSTSMVKKSRQFRRFLQVKPQITQVILDAAALSADDPDAVSVPSSHELPMGVDEISIWGKKFKIRLTSKKSGRKIDLNISFNKDFDPSRPGEEVE